MKKPRCIGSKTPTTHVQSLFVILMTEYRRDYFRRHYHLRESATTPQPSRTLTKQKNTPQHTPNITKSRHLSRHRREYFFGAQQDYEQALDLSSQSPQILYFYAGFLNWHLKDSARALEVVEKAVKLDPHNKDIAALKARVLTFLGRFEISWSIFEQILEDMTEQSIVFQIKTYGMALDCLRRWTEKLLSRREHNKAWETASIAMKLFDPALKINSQDEHIARTGC